MPAITLGPVSIGPSTPPRAGLSGLWTALIALGLSVVMGLAVGTGHPLMGAGLIAAGVGAAVAARVRSAAFALPATAVVLLFMPTTFPFQGITMAYLGAIVAAVWIGLWRGGGRMHWIAVPMLLLPLLSWLAEPAKLHALTQGEKPLAAIIAITWLACSVAATDPRTLDRLLLGVQWVSIAIAALAIYQYATDTWPIIDTYSRNAHVPGRSAGVFCHPIMYGTFTLAMLILAWTRRGMVWPLVIAANLIGITLSGARGAWVALGVVAAVSVAATAFRRRKAVRPEYAFFGTAAAIGVVVLIAGLLPTAASDVASQVQTRLSGDTAQISSAARDNRIQLGRSLITESPKTTIIGHGPDASTSYWNVHDLSDRGAAVWDNTYITIGYDYGLLGLLILGGALAYGVLAPGAWPGRLLLLGIAINLYTFDAGGWPTVAALLAFGFACRIAPPSASTRSTRPTRGRVRGSTVAV